MVLSSAILWHSAYGDLPSLDNRCWIDSTVADFYLSSIWHDMLGDALCRVVMVFRDSNNLQISPDDIERYQNTHLVPRNQSCPVVPVAFLVHDAPTSHFFAVVFDYTANTVYILGRRLSNSNPQYNSDWSTWRGPERWRIIADLHSWNASNPEDVLIMIRDWPQNGYDCGPIACALIRQCMEEGIDQTWELLSNVPIGSPPPIPCGHLLRLDMLAHVRQRCITSFNDYRHFANQQPMDWDYMELDEDIILQMHGGGDHARDNQLLRSLMLASSSCMECRTSIARYPGSTIQQREQDNEGEDTQEGPHDDEASVQDVPYAGTLLPLITNNRMLRGARLHRSCRPSVAVIHPSRTSRDVMERDIDLQQEQQQIPGELSSTAQASRKQVKDWRLGVTRRNPRISIPVPLEAHRGRRFIPHDYTYDDYDTGPTLDMLQHPEVYSILTHPYRQRTMQPAWIMWRDHGYRILTDSFQMSYLAPPSHLMDHIMAIGDMPLQVPIIVSYLICGLHLFT